MEDWKLLSYDYIQTWRQVEKIGLYRYSAHPITKRRFDLGLADNGG